MALVLVCEGPDDNRTLRAMIPSALREACDWLEAEHCGFQGLTESDEYFAWRSVDQEHKSCFPRNFGMSHMGKFDGEAAMPYASTARKALLVLKSRSTDADGFVLVCDEDVRDSRRLDGLRQARDASSLASRTAVGVARPKVEAWVLAGLQPQTDMERAALRAEIDALTFDPTQEPNRIRSQASGDVRDIKRVLDALTGGDHEREASAVSNIDRICQNGRDAGAVEFIEECRSRLAPLFGAAPRKN
jgi:hypothetical protein